MKRCLYRLAGPLTTVALLALVVGPMFGDLTLPASAAQPRTDLIASLTVDAVPNPDAEAWFLRIQVEPGGSLPADIQLGPTLLAAESGAITLSSDLPIVVDRAGDASPAPTSPGGDVTLAAGDVALIADGATLSAANQGDEPVSVLALFLISPIREASAGENDDAAGEPIGVTMTPLSVGRARFPAGPATLTIERVIVGVDDEMAVDSVNGVDLGLVEAGGASIALETGDLYLWRQIATAAASGNAGPEIHGPGARVRLVAGDGYCLSNAVASWRNDAGVETTMLRARVLPAPTGTPTGTS